MTPIPTLLWWILGINAALALAVAWWIHSDAARNHRAALKWSAASFMIGAVFGAPGGLLCYIAFHQAVEKEHAGGFWAALAAVFGIPGYIAFYTYDDCKSRDMNASLWASASFFLALPAIVPWMLFQMLYVLLRRPVKRPTITVESIKERYGRRAQLEKLDDVLLRVENLKKYFPVRRHWQKRPATNTKYPPKQ